LSVCPVVWSWTVGVCVLSVCPVVWSWTVCLSSRLIVNCGCLWFVCLSSRLIVNCGSLWVSTWLSSTCEQIATMSLWQFSTLSNQNHSATPRMLSTARFHFQARFVANGILSCLTQCRLSCLTQWQLHVCINLSIWQHLHLQSWKWLLILLRTLLYSYIFHLSTVWAILHPPPTSEPITSYINM